MKLLFFGNVFNIRLFIKYIMYIWYIYVNIYKNREGKYLRMYDNNDLNKGFFVKINVYVK